MGMVQAVVDTSGAPSAAQLLSADINKATRSLHIQLNRYITSRLPLCLPPNTTNPAIYAAGLEYFAHVFLTFESLFQDITLQSSVNNPALSALLEDPWVHVPHNVKQSPSSTPSTTPTSEHDVEIQTFLASLLPRGLPRSRRLLADIAYLKNQDPANLSASLARFPGEKIHEFASHIRKEVADKPHILIAYTWCFYMAVFSGGRWIRSQLMAAGSDFWQATRDKASADKDPSEAGLAFFNFEGPEDGEDIKAEFKARLAAGENILSQQERDEVVEEAQNIFSFCNSMVEELDVMIAGQQPASEASAQQSAASGTHRPAASVAENAGVVRILPTNETWQTSQSVAVGVVAAGVFSWYALKYFGMS